jgi:hypothetical protein
MKKMIAYKVIIEKLENLTMSYGLTCNENRNDNLYIFIFITSKNFI